MKFPGVTAIAAYVCMRGLSPVKSLAPNRLHRSNAIPKVASRDAVVPQNDAMSSSIIAGQEEQVGISARNARILAPLSLAALLLTSNSEPVQALQSMSEGFERSRTQYFSGALSSSVMALRISGTLRKRGYFPYNTLLASSMSSDELNDTPTSLVPTLKSKMTNIDTGVFRLSGGTTGVPARGPNGGLAEFVSHSPAGAKLLVILAPSVGIDKDGTIGQVERFGQEQSSLSSAFLSAVVDGKPTSPESGADAKAVKEKLKSQSGKNQNDVMAAATLALYDVGYDILKEQINAITSQPSTWSTVNEIIFLGGIIVHRGRASGMPKGEDFFQPLTIKSYTISGEKQLYNELFGDLSTPRGRA